MYTSGILTNSGNYRGFGDSKIVPNLSEEKFAAVVKLSEASRREPKIMQSLWDRCREKIFSLDEKEKILGFADKVSCLHF